MGDPLRSYAPWTAVLTGVILLALVMVANRRHAPLALANSAWTGIRLAERDAAEHFSPLEYQSAIAAHDSAWIVIREQRQRPWLLRDYQLASLLFVRATTDARAARESAAAGRKAKHVEMETRLRYLDERVDYYRDLYADHLMYLPLRQVLTTAELRCAIARRDASFATDALAESTLAAAERALDVVAEAYFSDMEGADDDHRRWRDWVNETVAWSAATNSPALIVVKDTHCAYLLRGGSVVRHFDADLGLNSGGQKRRSGDGATPEGVYHVTRVRNTGSSYYKALDLNYPNAVDQLRFEMAQEDGRIPSDADIGGDIQVHGEGGKGKDWTEGCIALENGVMDSLVSLMEVGDLVTVVRRVDGWPR